MSSSICERLSYSSPISSCERIVSCLKISVPEASFASSSSTSFFAADESWRMGLATSFVEAKIMTPTNKAVSASISHAILQAKLLRSVMTSFIRMSTPTYPAGCPSEVRIG